MMLLSGFDILVEVDCTRLDVNRSAPLEHLNEKELCDKQIDKNESLIASCFK